MNEVIWVYMTASNRKEAEQIGAALVEKRLAACVNIWQGMSSLYEWEGQVHQEQETVLVAKTAADRFQELERAVTELHSYDCPCIVALPVSHGHAPFLEWIREQTGD